MFEKEPWEASRTFLNTLYYVFFLSQDFKSMILDFLHILKLEASYVRPAFAQFNQAWQPSLSDEKIIREICSPSPEQFPSFNSQIYQIYLYGGLYGLVGILVSKTRSLVYRRDLSDIKSKTNLQWFASNISCLFQTKENDWIKGFLQEPNTRPIPSKSITYY